MQVFRSWYWTALAVALGFATPAAHAGLITPDSIPNPPSAVDSTNGTPVFSNNLVTTQYAGMGLNFGGAAITLLHGVSVWVPVAPAAASLGTINFSTNDSLTGRFVLPASSNAMTVSSLSLEIIGQIVPRVYGSNGQLLNLVPDLQSSPGLHGGEVWTFSGTGIASFSGLTVPIDPMGQGGPLPNPWGIAEVSFTPASAPEPSSLVLAGLGALGMATRLGWRRFRQLA